MGIEARKHTIMWDNVNGKVECFYNYKGNKIDFSKEIVRVLAGK